MDDRTAALGALRVELERTWARHTVRSALLQEEVGGIDAPSKMLLKAVHAAPGSRSSEIADRCGMSRPVVSRRIAAMAASGLIALATDPEDRRASLLSTTAMGAERVTRLEHDSSSSLRRMVEGFTLHELRTLEDLLHRLNDRATEQQDLHQNRTDRVHEGAPSV